jgi:hypothetical protein
MYTQGGRGCRAAGGPFPHSCQGSNRAGPYQAFDRCCPVFPDGTQAALAARRRVPLKDTVVDAIEEWAICPETS